MNLTMTGASGLIGRRLIKNMSAAGHKVTPSLAPMVLWPHLHQFLAGCHQA